VLAMSDTKETDGSAEETQPAGCGRRGLLERLNDALGPIAGGIILDVVDFATFGPIGLFIGWIAGGLTGWWIGSIYKFSTRGRILLAIAAAAYCSAPGTEFLPLATIVSAIARFWDTERRPQPGG
jgi:hypothetical protein